VRLSLHGVEVDINNFTETDYEAVRKVIEVSFGSKHVKNRDVIKNAFIEAVQRGPLANPSDLWHHVVYRLYIEMAKRYQPHLSNPGQSWARASGDAFELFLEAYYNRILADTKVRLVALVDKTRRVQALKLLRIYGKVGDSKLDIAIMGNCKPDKTPSLENGNILGGIHAKVSLAERVSDDVPASSEMMRNGFVSYLATLDVKSFPPSPTVGQKSAYINKGELGTPQAPTDKRKYIEAHGSFDACFSYNLRTVASPEKTTSGKKIYVSGLDNIWDHLCDVLVAVNDKDQGESGT
jgi:hypothetical protein